MKRLSIAAAALVLILMLAPRIAPYDPAATDAEQAARPPSLEHPLGTDMLGRDVLSRMLHGGQRTLLRTGTAALVVMVTGGTLGVLTAVAPRPIRHTLSVLLNALLAIPGLISALVVLTLLGQGDAPLVAAVALGQIAGFAFYVRAVTVSIYSAPYIEGARAIGAGGVWIVRRHVLPNLLPHLAGYAAVTFGYCLLNGAALGFLGLGGDPGIPEWGALLFDGRQALRSAPWIGLAPGIGITVLVWMVSALGDTVIRRG
jgi:ABC-type dipeptide/oligopeptide/nickel transport system permease subunit